MADPRTSQRGAALLLVLVAVAVLTALAVDLAYESRVSLRIAANARDELRASAMAEGGVALARAVLSLQQRIDATLGTPGAAAGRNQAMPAFPRPQLWRLVPVGDSLAAGLFGGPGGGAPAGEAVEGGARPRGDGFDVDVDDEARKVNVQLDTGGALLAAQVRALYQLVCDPRWDALFDREDANGQRVSRQDLLVYLRDWVDPLDVASALAAGFPPGGCEIVVPPVPFENGFGDENFPYDRGEDRYRVKNARMDSLAELHLVAGVTDAFLAAFGDAITVYPPREARQNVNDLRPEALLLNAAIAADPQGQPELRNPEFLQRLQQLALEKTFGGLLAMTPADFAQLVKAAGVTVNEVQLGPQSTQNPFTDRSTTFRLRAVGRAGDVAKTLDVVVWMNDPANAPVTTPGRVVHWSEE